MTWYKNHSGAATHRLVGSGRRMASDLGASSPSTMWAMLMTAKAAIRLIEWAASAGRLGKKPKSGCSRRLTAGSPTMPSPMLASVMPSWVADR